MKIFLFVLMAVAFTFIQINADSCVQCDSNTDARCATDPMSLLAKNCLNTSSKCYTRIVNGATVRGCASDLTNATANACNNEMDCLICSFMEGCNRQIFPTHRAQCLQCDGNSTNSTCATNVYEKASVCPIYNLGDKCYIRNTGRTGVDRSFQRGCLSSAQAKKTCVKDGNCFTCEGLGCNFLAANDTQIPQARDGAALTMVSMALLFGCLLFGRTL